MNITSKSRYALKIMLDLSQCAPNEHTHRTGVAERQGIPLDYMDHILSRLRERQLIDSIRGRGGGYRLARPSAQIDVWQIFSAVEDGFKPVQCLDSHHHCQVEAFCSSKDAWSQIAESIYSSLSGISLASLVSKAKRAPIKVVGDNKLRGKSTRSTRTYPKEGQTSKRSSLGREVKCDDSRRDSVVALKNIYECRAPSKSTNGATKNEASS